MYSVVYSLSHFSLNLLGKSKNDRTIRKKKFKNAENCYFGKYKDSLERVIYRYLYTLTYAFLQILII